MNLLFDLPVPPPIEDIDLRCCGVDEVLSEVRGARLIVADPCWHYEQATGLEGAAEDVYDCLPDSEIVRHLDRAYDSAGPACRLAVWYTWPKDAGWTSAGGAGPRWGERKTGGAWFKMEPIEGGARRVQTGVGFHWRGLSEPVALFTRGACGRPNGGMLLNAHVSLPTGHSEKPMAWMREWILAWTSPGDLVLDLYAGLAPLARACLGTGRRYIGAEIDPERHLKAMERLHAAQSRMR